MLAYYGVTVLSLCVRASFPFKFEPLYRVLRQPIRIFMPLQEDILKPILQFITQKEVSTL